jgi:hypothetical protein
LFYSNLLLFNINNIASILNNISTFSRALA